MWKRIKEGTRITKSSLIGQDVRQAAFRWQDFNAEKVYLAQTKLPRSDAGVSGLFQLSYLSNYIFYLFIHKAETFDTTAKISRM